MFNESITRKWGWKPDVPDRRDFKYKVTAPIELPDMVDLRPGFSPVEDQGSLGSCTSNALVGLLEFLEKKEQNKFYDLSRLFVYYNAREIEGTTDSDSGAYLRDGIKALAKMGVCQESEPLTFWQKLTMFMRSKYFWEYDPRKFDVQPTRGCYSYALNHRIKSYYRLETVEEMMQCLAEGYPFAFGFAVYQNFMSAEVRKTGILGMPGDNESEIGGHAVDCVGYDLNMKIFPDSIGSGLIRNSWGTAWGLEGYFWIPLEYLVDRNLSDDFWVVRK